MTLSELFLSHDVLLHVFSFLPFRNTIPLERSCKYFHNLLREDYIDKSICKMEISHLPFLLDLQFSKEFDEFLNGENCRKLLGDFYTSPFLVRHLLCNSGREHEQEDEEEMSEISKIYRDYCEKGGVLDIQVVIPCKLLRGVMKWCGNELIQDWKILFHKFVLFAQVCRWSLAPNSLFQIGKTKEEVFFNEEQRYYASSFQSTQLVMGIGLIMMQNNFTKFTHRFPLAISTCEANLIGLTRRKQKKLVFSTPTTPIDVVIYSDLIRNAWPKEGKHDIFQQCSRPPHPMKNASKEVNQLTKLLYGEGICEHYCWDSYLNDNEGTWAQYWLAGMEWWGCHAMTSYDYTKERFIVATASTTD